MTPFRPHRDSRDELDACPRCGGTGTIGGRTGNDPQTSWHDDCSCQSWLTDADMVRDQTRPGK